jgi:DNA-binding MarR family transcriptional regulator
MQPAYVSYLTYVVEHDADAVARAQALRVAVGRVARRMRQLYALDHGAGPSFTEVAVLVRLARDGPTSPTELAGQERVTSQAIAAVVRELENRSLVARSAHPEDGRRTVIAITPAGHDVLHDREQTVMTGLLRALSESCSEAELRHLDAAIPVLDHLADTM